jgi:hypothetical protein
LALILAAVGIHGSFRIRWRTQPMHSGYAWRWGRTRALRRDGDGQAVVLAALGVVIGWREAWLTRLLRFDAVRGERNRSDGICRCFAVPALRGRSSYLIASRLHSRVARRASGAWDGPPK